MTLVRSSRVERSCATERDPWDVPLGGTLHRHRSSLKSYFARRTRHADDVDDLIQDVYVRVLASGFHLGEVGSWRSLLFRIAATALIDKARRRRARGGDRHGPLEEALSIPASGPTPDQALEAAQLAETVRLALLQLDPIRRQIFILARLEGMSHKEIGTRLDMEPVKVGRQLERALAHLMKAVADR